MDGCDRGMLFLAHVIPLSALRKLVFLNHVVEQSLCEKVLALWIASRSWT
jgi:hypothetical protein